MNVLVAASEVAGFAKTGGLADVTGSLPRALARRGHSCVVILPLYRCTRAARPAPEPTEHTFEVTLGDKRAAGRLWRSQWANKGSGRRVPVYLIEQASYFDRDDPKEGRGLYQFTTADGRPADYPDNCERFTFFCRAVLEAVRVLDLRPDVLHANDWQTGLLPVYLKEVYRGPPYEGVRTLFTLHNVGYQGLFPHWDLPVTGLDPRLFNPRALEYYGQLSFLKAGIVFADLINTVSPTYAREIQTPYFGHGLQGVLSENRGRLHGIVNGVDYEDWGPAHDRHLAKAYDAETVADGKPFCKAALQKRFGLPERPRTPVLGMVARLVEQKGIELVIQAAEPMLREDTQLIVLGTGDPIYHQQLSQLRERYPDRVGLYLGFDTPLAHQIEAGADLFLMPSLYEPCGLNQLYSMKYGTPPVVRATGGLADTVVDGTPENLASGRATGFRFLAHSADALLEAVRRGLALYRQHPDVWLRLVQTGMRQDWSWDRSARAYEDLYASLARGS